MAQLLMRVRTGAALLHASARIGVVPPTFNLDAELFELLPIRERDVLLQVAQWLLIDWPTNFLDTSDACSFSLDDFSGTLQLAPTWIVDTVKRYLTKRKRGIVTLDSITKATAAIEYEGETVTKTAVRKALGVSESVVLNRVMYRRTQGTRQELNKILERFSEQLAHASHSRGHRVSLARDYVLFMLSVATGLSIEGTCALSLREVRILLSDYAKSSGQRSTLGVQIKCVLETELKIDLAWEEPDGYQFFQSRWGKPILGHSARTRVSMLMRCLDDKFLWRSADVFRFTLDKLDDS